MRNVYINDVSVLWELKVQNKTTRYHGATELSPFTETCADVSTWQYVNRESVRTYDKLNNKIKLYIFSPFLMVAGPDGFNDAVYWKSARQPHQS